MIDLEFIEIKYFRLKIRKLKIKKTLEYRKRLITYILVLLRKLNNYPLLKSYVKSTHFIFYYFLQP